MEADNHSLGLTRKGMILHKEAMSMILTAVFFLSMLIPMASSLSFNIPSFDQEAMLKIDPDGDWLTNDNTLVLTKDGVNMGGSARATYTDPLLLWDAKTRELTDFTTEFSFIIYSSQKNYADGLAFFLTKYGSSVPVFSKGGYLGLFSNSTSVNSTSDSTVAVEFDTFSNHEKDIGDPIGEHLGIDINSIRSSANVSWNSSIKEGKVANARVDYSSSTYNLSVFVTYAKTNLSPAANYSLHYVVDLRKVLPEKVSVGFSAAVGNFTETHSILSWSFSSTLKQKKDKSNVGLAAGLAVGVTLMLVLCSLCFILYRKKKKKLRHLDNMDCDEAIDHEFESERGPKRFPFQELASATKNFSEDRKLGEGGFGSVYRGQLTELNLDVAIKRISKGSKQGKKEYISEVKAISRLRHRNLVQLIGWCHTRGEFLLVYEFMPNGSLDSYLYGKKQLLEWPVRHKIALGLASALSYLHDEWEQCVVHRDIKPSNVMLDSAFNAKLGDFGLARLVDHDHDLQTTDVAGTRGYMAPECFYTGKANKESDVYSFGIVALEIACGKKKIEHMEEPSKVRFVEWVWELYGRRMIMEAADEKLNGNFDERQMESLMVVGLWCAHPDYSLRPSIKQVISTLSFEIPLPMLPPVRPVPMYYTPSFHVFSVATPSVTETTPSGQFAHSFELPLSPHSLIDYST